MIRIQNMDITGFSFSQIDTYPTKKRCAADQRNLLHNVFCYIAITNSIETIEGYQL